MPIRNRNNSFQGRIQDLKLREGALNKISASGARRENFGDISCEKSYFSNFRPPPLDPPLVLPYIRYPNSSQLYVLNGHIVC